MRKSVQEQVIIDNFMGTIAGQSLDEAMANAERDASSYGLSSIARRVLGNRVRLHFARKSA